MGNFGTSVSFTPAENVKVPKKPPLKPRPSGFHESSSGLPRFREPNTSPALCKPAIKPQLMKVPQSVPAYRLSSPKTSLENKAPSTFALPSTPSLSGSTTSSNPPPLCSSHPIAKSSSTTPPWLQVHMRPKPSSLSITQSDSNLPPWKTVQTRPILSSLSFTKSDSTAPSRKVAQSPLPSSPYQPILKTAPTIPPCTVVQVLQPTSPAPIDAIPRPSVVLLERSASAKTFAASTTKSALTAPNTATGNRFSTAKPKTLIRPVRFSGSQCVGRFPVNQRSQVLQQRPQPASVRAPRPFSARAAASQVRLVLQHSRPVPRAMMQASNTPQLRQRAPLNVIQHASLSAKIKPSDPLARLDDVVSSPPMAPVHDAQVWVEEGLLAIKPDPDMGRGTTCVKREAKEEEPIPSAESKRLKVEIVHSEK